MRIINLIENTEGANDCKIAHGLSFYVETENHRLLLDLGPSEETLENAGKLGIDLGKVDTVILSHGHFDHSGGILPYARALEDTAGAGSRPVFYLQESAFGPFYADEGRNAEERYRYIGIDPQIAELPGIRRLRGNCRINEELSLFTISERSHALPFTNRSLLVKQGEDEYIRDNFDHEQYLVICDGGRHVLMSGCAHNGILSILDEYRRLYDADPDLVISGFHLMKKTSYKEEQLKEIRSIATELKSYRSRFLTCHCTGLAAYEIMKEILKDQLDYIHSGEEVELGQEAEISSIQS